MSRVVAAFVLAGTLAFVACRATTSRPPFVALPESAHGEIGFGVPDPVSTLQRVVRTLAEALAEDSIPIQRVSEEDGYLESPWFDAASLLPTEARPVGPDVVRVRAWVGPAKPGYSSIEVETVYRPVADPSRSARDLEEHVAVSHPVGQRISRVVERLIEQHGEPSDSVGIRATAAPPPVDPTAPAAPADTTAPAAPADTTGPAAPADTVQPSQPDTTPPRWPARRLF